jgi:hypothetical protein
MRVLPRRYYRLRSSDMVVKLALLASYLSISYLHYFQDAFKISKLAS